MRWTRSALTSFRTFTTLAHRGRFISPIYSSRVRSYSQTSTPSQTPPKQSHSKQAPPKKPHEQPTKDTVIDARAHFKALEPLLVLGLDIDTKGIAFTFLDHRSGYISADYIETKV